MKLRFVALLVATLIAAVVAPTASASGDRALTALVVPSSGSFLYLNSQPGDYIGGGVEQLYTSQDSTVWASLPQGRTYFAARFIQGVYVHTWHVEMDAPPGQPLTLGSYTGAVRAGLEPAGIPGLQIDGDYRGCNTLSGQFVVDELSYSSSGVLLVFDATFEQHCEGQTAALFGRVRYQDETRAGVTLPSGSVSVPTSGNFLYLNNTLGYELLFTQHDSTFGPWEKLFRGGDRFQAFVVQGSYAHSSSVDIAAPLGEPLAVGSYVRAVRSAFRPPGSPGLDVGADGGGCNEVVGKFDVDELSFAPTGELLVFQATFEQRCVNTINVLYGRIRIENPFRPGVALPAGNLAVPTSGNFLYLNSEPTDWVGAGLEELYTGADATFAGSISDAQDYFSGSLVQGNYVHWWYFDIAAPSGVPLAVGSYVRAFRAPFRPEGWPGLDVHGDGRGCNTILGKYDVNELSYWPNGDLRTFQATFEQHCEGGLPALFGRLRYEAPPPVQLAVTLRDEGVIPTKTIGATIRGTVSCSRAVTVDLTVSLTQLQAKGVTVTGTLTMPVSCSGPSVTWSADLAPDSGAFKQGSATGAVNATVCERRCTSASAVGAIKLNTGKS